MTNEERRKQIDALMRDTLEVRMKEGAFDALSDVHIEPGSIEKIDGGILAEKIALEKRVKTLELQLLLKNITVIVLSVLYLTLIYKLRS